MKPVVPLAVAALFAGAAGFAASGAAPQDPAVKAFPAGKGVTMLEGQGGNVGVLASPQGVLVVDAQFDRMAPALREAIAKLQPDAPVQWLINTHHHGDHVGGNAQLGAGAVRMAHAKVRERMTGDESAKPFLTWQDGVTLHFGGQRVETIHHPAAHTDGDSIVVFHDAKVVHLGDLFFNRRFPYVDMDSGGSVGGMLAALESVRKEVPPDWKLIPGHGPLATAEDLDASIAMIRATLAIVRQRVDAGMSRDAIVAAGLPEEWAGWSWQFISTDRWLATLARECGAR